jgi:hypothetical protein
MFKPDDMWKPWFVWVLLALPPLASSLELFAIWRFVKRLRQHDFSVDINPEFLLNVRVL